MQAPRPYIYEDWLELQAVIARDERGDELVYCQNPPVLDSTPQPIKLRKPWAEIVYDKTFKVWRVLVLRTFGKRRRMWCDGAYEIRANAVKSMNDSLKRDWTSYNQEKERIDGITR